MQNALAMQMASVVWSRKRVRSKCNYASLCRRAQAAGDSRGVRMAEKSMVVELLKAQFGAAVLDHKTELITVSIPSNQVTVDWESDTVTCSPTDDALHMRITTCLERMRAALERIQPRQLSGTDTSTALSKGSL